MTHLRRVSNVICSDRGRSTLISQTKTRLKVVGERQLDRQANRSRAYRAAVKHPANSKKDVGTVSSSLDPLPSQETDNDARWRTAFTCRLSE